MENNHQLVETPTTPNPTPTFHKQNADAFIAGLDSLAATLPKVEKADPGQVRVATGVTLEFMAAAVAEVEQSDDARKRVALDVAASQDRLQYVDAYTTVYSRILKLASEVKDTIDAYRTTLAFDTLQVYSTIQRLARQRGTGRVAFQIMQKELGRKRRVKLSPPTPSPTSPANPGTAPPVKEK